MPQVGYAIVKMLLQGGISGDAPDPGPLPVIQRDAFLLAIPWIVLTAILLGGGGWLFLSWRRHRDDELAHEWAEQAEAEALHRAEANLAGQRAASATGPAERPLDQEGSR